MTIGIYEILNKTNDKRYIGSSKDIETRFKVHLSLLKCNKHFNKHLQSAWNKYGEEAFEFNATELCEQEELFIREKHYIDTLDVLDHNNGYNVCPNPATSTAGTTWSQESKDKLSKTLIEDYASGKRKKLNYLHTISAKEAISKATKGRIPTNRKSIWCHQTGKEYPSLHCAAKELKISVSGICDVLTKKKGLCQGYTFDYIDNSNRDIRLKVLKVPKIMCIETGITYNNQTKAAKSVNGKSCDLGRAIKKERKFKGFTFKKVK